jgi:hypothetical protein
VRVSPGTTRVPVNVSLAVPLKNPPTRRRYFGLVSSRTLNQKAPRLLHELVALMCRVRVDRLVQRELHEDRKVVDVEAARPVRDLDALLLPSKTTAGLPCRSVRPGDVAEIDVDDLAGGREETDAHPTSATARVTLPRCRS